METAPSTGPRPPTRIGLDGYNLALLQGTGVATYARNLSHALKAMGAEIDVIYGRHLAGERDPELRETAFFDPVGAPRRTPWTRIAPYLRAPGALTAGLPARRVPVTGRILTQDVRERLPSFDRLWNVQQLFAFANGFFHLTGRLARVRMPDPPAIMHWTYPVPVELVGARNIYTLHDLVPLRLPHTTLDDKAGYLRLMRALARRADHLVTVSEASRRDIIELLGVAPERVTNTYQSVEPPASLTTRSPAESAALVRSATGLEPQGYHLFFGAIEPKKNVARLAQAFLAAGTAAPLIVVGKAAWKSDEAMSLMGGEGEQGRIRHMPYLATPLLTALIENARSVIFPSLYEGFGLPVLEAMGLGAPVITSTGGGLPEVAGEAALLVDPYDVDALAAAIRRLDGDAGLRRELSARGRVQAARFAPERYRERLADLYGRLGAEF